ncbi:hypothetical protein VCNEP21106_003506A, partial [Vibrio cholerae O1 str. Nep-21106]
MVNDFSEL